MDLAREIVAGDLTVFWMLVAVTGVALMTKRIHISYPVGLVLVGLGLTFIPGLPRIMLTPELILRGFLPVLLFAAAYSLPIMSLRENLPMISALAIPGLLLTAGVVTVVMVAAGFSWPSALLFGAIVGATDPVSVLAAFQELGVPLRLRAIIEGESLFNDGTALVLFRLLLGLLLTRQLDLSAGLAQFVLVIFGGLFLGLAAGYLVAQLLQRLADDRIEIMFTLILAYGVYFLAEQVQVSGVIAVVMAGLLIGNYRPQITFAPTSERAICFFWKFSGFLANSLIFLLIGLQIPVVQLTTEAGPVAVAIGAVLVARVVTVGLITRLLHLTHLARPLPVTGQMLLIWGGLRGALSLAMALSIPQNLPAVDETSRNRLLVMTCGVILFTLVIQGLTMPLLLRRIRFHQMPRLPRETRAYAPRRRISISR